MTKQELIINGKHYFDKDNVKVMYAFEDGNYFHAHHKLAADKHAVNSGFNVIKITRADLNKPKREVKLDDVISKLKTDKKQ